MTVPDHPLRMVRLHLDDVPRHEVPLDFRIRGYRPGDDATWTDIQLEAEPFLEIDAGVFGREFGDDVGRLANRCLFLTTADGFAVGTVTAWQRPLMDSAPEALKPRDVRSFRAAVAQARAEPWGLCGWIAIRPEYQGRGLARPLISASLRRLAAEHARCFAVTSTARTVAIRLFVEFGFRPDLRQPAARDAWDRLAMRSPDLASVTPVLHSEQLGRR